MMTRVSIYTCPPPFLQHSCPPIFACFQTRSHTISSFQILKDILLLATYFCCPDITRGLSRIIWSKKTERFALRSLPIKSYPICSRELVINHMLSEILDSATGLKYCSDRMHHHSKHDCNRVILISDNINTILSEGNSNK